MTLDDSIFPKIKLVLQKPNSNLRVIFTHSIIIQTSCEENDNFIFNLHKYSLFASKCIVRDKYIEVYRTEKLESTIKNVEILKCFNQLEKFGLHDEDIEDIVGFKFVIQGHKVIIPKEFEVEIQERIHSEKQSIEDSNIPNQQDLDNFVKEIQKNLEKSENFDSESEIVDFSTIEEKEHKNGIE